MTGGAAGYVWSSSRQPWGLHNLTIYVTHYYHTVVHAANVSGFRMSHVRVRAWAFLGGGIGSMAGLQEKDIEAARVRRGATALPGMLAGVGSTRAPGPKPLLFDAVLGKNISLTIKPIN